MEARQEVTPMQVRETRVYLPNNAGGFDLRDCPNAEELAAFIVRSCNAHDELAKFVQKFVRVTEGEIGNPEVLLRVLRDEARAALAKAGAA